MAHTRLAARPGSIGLSKRAPAWALIPAIWCLAAAGAQAYMVQPGDTLYAIARRFGLSVERLSALNQLHGNAILPGQKLSVDPGAEPPEPPANPAAGGGAPAKAVRLDAAEDQVRLLAEVIEAEAGGESFLGQVAVGAVVVNRVHDPRFPDTIAAVIEQPGQFAAVADDKLPAAPSEEAMQAARTALLGVDPSGGALFFHNPDKPAGPESSDFWRRREVLLVIGRHAFAR